MSASDKKKLRKEQQAAAMTEKQQQEKKEAKKLKVYTISFIVAMVLVVVIVLGSVLHTPVSNAINRNRTALIVGDHELSVAEFNYFYCDAIESFTNQYDGTEYEDYAYFYLVMQGYDPYYSVGDQYYDEAKGITWADHFVDLAIENAKWTYAMYDLAVANNFTVSDSTQATIDSLEATLEATAKGGSFSNAESYLRSVYGYGASVESYVEYYTVSMTASEYVNDYYGTIEFAEEDYREYEKEHYDEFSSYRFAYYAVNVTDYLADAKNYTAEEYAAAVAAAEADAIALSKYSNRTLEALNASIAALEVNKDKEGAAATELRSVLHSSLSSTLNNDEITNWIIDSARKAGDRKYFTVTGANDDGTTAVKGYAVVLFEKYIDNNLPIVNFRHLFVPFEGTKDETTGKVVYTQAAKDAALEKAEGYLKEYEEAKLTGETAFSTLVMNYSTASDKATGGLCSNVAPSSSDYNEAVMEWLFQEREEGDVEIVMVADGYEILFYVGANELNYRDTMINTVLVANAYGEWQNSVLDSITVTEVYTKGVNKDYIP